MEKNQEERREQEIVYSRSVKAGKRIYYLDVRKARNNDLYLSITESKRRQAERRRQERTASEQHHEDTGLVRVRTRRPPSGRRPSDGKR